MEYVYKSKYDLQFVCQLHDDMLTYNHQQLIAYNVVECFVRIISYFFSLFKSNRVHFYPPSMVSQLGEVIRKFGHLLPSFLRVVVWMQKLQTLYKNAFYPHPKIESEIKGQKKKNKKGWKKKERSGLFGELCILPEARSPIFCMAADYPFLKRS